MLEIYFFVLGLANALLLIAIFRIRKSRLAFLQRYGWTYLLLAIPTVFGIYLAIHEHKSIQYSVFLGIFLTYLILEGLLDHVFKINFRENWQKNWRWMIPYLVLYYAMNYGFVIMPWKTSLSWGIVMLSLMVIQIIANIQSHPKAK